MDFPTPRWTRWHRGKIIYDLVCHEYSKHLSISLVVPQGLLDDGVKRNNFLFLQSVENMQPELRGGDALELLFHKSHTQSIFARSIFVESVKTWGELTNFKGSMEYHKLFKFTRDWIQYPSKTSLNTFPFASHPLNGARPRFFRAQSSKFIHFLQTIKMETTHWVDWQNGRESEQNLIVITPTRRKWQMR